jgi:hypothetical protein
MATRDDVIPLETPYTDRNGTVHETLKRVFFAAMQNRLCM